MRKPASSALTTASGAKKETMKIAIVSQPLDTIMPPYQNSVGACTYGVALPLSEAAEVLIYGLKDRHGDLPSLSREQRIDFRLFAATRLDRFLFSLQKKAAKLFPRSSPISTSKWLYPSYGRMVARDLKQQRCDVIHLQHCSQYAPIIRAANPEARIVLHLHAEWFSQTNHAMLKNRLAAVDLVTTVGDYITKKTKRDFPFISDRCETVYNGIDGQEFSREMDYGTARRRLVKRILYSGAISPHKGLHVLLRAFVIVARKYPNVVLEIVGPNGNYPIEETFDLKDKPTLKSLRPFYATSLWSVVKSKFTSVKPRDGVYLSHLKSSLPPDVAEKVLFLGLIPRQELIDRYYSSDIFAFAPIWNEGFGLPPVEAMAAGLPVVASRSGAVTETVVEGQTGLLVEKNNVEELANALLVLLKDDGLREVMGRAGRRRAFEHFTWFKVAKQMHARYDEMLSA
jgi:glycosyltransferase involved in cell wall biosynthesis